MATRLSQKNTKNIINSQLHISFNSFENKNNNKNNNKIDQNNDLLDNIYNINDFYDPYDNEDFLP